MNNQVTPLFDHTLVFTNMGEHTKENIVDVSIYPHLPTNDEFKNLFLEKVGKKFILKKETSSGKPHIVIYRPQARLFDGLTEEFISSFEKHEKSLLVVLGEDVSKHHLDELEKRFKCTTFPLQTTLRKMKKGSCDKKTWKDLWKKMDTLFENMIQRRRTSIMRSISGRWGKQIRALPEEDSDTRAQPIKEPADMLTSMDGTLLFFIGTVDMAFSMMG